MEATDSGGTRRFNTATVRHLISRLRPRSKPRRLQCQEMVELVTAYLEGALDPEMLTRFEQHLEKCDGCAEYLEQLRVTIRVAGSIRDEELDPDFRSRLLDAFEETAGSW